MSQSIPVHFTIRDRINVNLPDINHMEEVVIGATDNPFEAFMGILGEAFRRLESSIEHLKENSIGALMKDPQIIKIHILGLAIHIDIPPYYILYTVNKKSKVSAVVVRSLLRDLRTVIVNDSPKIQPSKFTSIWEGV